MPYEFKHQRRVEFPETDMAGIVHFSNYFRYMEAAEHAFFRSLGFSVAPYAHGDVIGWARGHVDCTYLAPLHFEDLLELQVLVTGKSRRTIDYIVVFRRVGDSTVLAHGAMTVVCVAKPPGDGRMRSAEIPSEIDARIEVAPADVIAQLGLG